MTKANDLKEIEKKLFELGEDYGEVVEQIEHLNERAFELEKEMLIWDNKKRKLLLNTTYSKKGEKLEKRNSK